MEEIRMMKTAPEKYPRSRLLTVLSIITTVMLCVFILEKIFLPQGKQGLSIPPLIDGVIFLGLGVSLSVAMAQYSYQAWSLGSRDFMEWCFSQQIVSMNWLQKWYSPQWFRSRYRLMGPIGFLVGIAMAGLGLVIIAAPLFAA